ncbi:hypothetical protein D3C81_1419070 [compost metagenome]
MFHGAPVPDTVRGSSKQLFGLGGSPVSSRALHALLLPPHEDLLHRERLHIIGEPKSPQGGQGTWDRPIREHTAKFREVQVDPADDTITHTGGLFCPVFPVMNHDLQALESIGLGMVVGVKSTADHIRNG